MNTRPYDGGTDMRPRKVPRSSEPRFLNCSNWSSVEVRRPSAVEVVLDTMLVDGTMAAGHGCTLYSHAPAYQDER